MWIGTLFALAAGLLWGLVFIGPLLLPDYPPALLSFGRYLAFGIVALPIAWAGRQPLRSLTRADWIEAAKLVLVGNLLYYLFLASAIQRAPNWSRRCCRWCIGWSRGACWAGPGSSPKKATAVRSR